MKAYNIVWIHPSWSMLTQQFNLKCHFKNKAEYFNLYKTNIIHGQYSIYMLIDMTQITMICKPTIFMEFSINRKSKKWLKKLKNLPSQQRALVSRKKEPLKPIPKVGTPIL